MASHSGWLGILKWSLAQGGGDGTAESKFEPMSEASSAPRANWRFRRAKAFPLTALAPLPLAPSARARRTTSAG